MMTEQEFETLWQRAEAAPHAGRLAEGYRPWLQRRRRTMAAVAAVAVITLAAVPLLKGGPSASVGENGTVAYCNNTERDSQYWLEMADALLMEA